VGFLRSIVDRKEGITREVKEKRRTERMEEIRL
jgi:hypothetical protein